MRTVPPRDGVWLAPARRARVEIRVRGSRFLASVAPAADGAAAAAHLQDLRDEFPRATHHCWGLRVRESGALVEHCSDAGEPPGTGGRPILRALQAAGVEGACVVVVRWFGGAKLGVGPLARAYRDAAAAALARAGACRQRRHALFRVRFPHADSGEVRRALARLGAEVRQEIHGEAAELEVGLPLDRAAALPAAVAGATRGEGRIQEVGLATVVVR